jgi:hypothetical protein
MRTLLLATCLVCASAIAASAQVGAQSTPQSPSRGPAQTAPPVTPVNPATGARNPAPSSAIGAPLPALQPLPSMSPQITTAPLSSGGSPSNRSSSLGTPGSLGTVLTNRAPTGSASASEAAASAPGGGGSTLADCMSFWDRDTHMTKSEWRAACKRTLVRIDTIDAESKKSTKSGKTSNR